VTWDLRLGDCLAPVTGLASLPDKSVDVVITDPPYDARTHERARSLKDGGSDIPIDFAPLSGMEHVAACLRVSRRWVIAFCSMEQLGVYRDASGDETWIRSAVWVRTNGTPQISGDRPGQGAEGIAIMHPEGKKRWNGGGERGAWIGQREADSVHPTQKPIWLMEKIVALFTDPGELVLDPFAGSGTTGVAAIRLGRRFLGWERDPKYHAAASKRLAGTREQTDLFRPKAPKAKQETLL